MQTDEQMASALYPDTTPKPANTDTSARLVSAAITQDQVLETLYPASADAARAVEAETDALFAGLGATEAQRTAISNTFQEIARNGVPGFLAADLAKSFIAREVEASRATDPEAYAVAVRARSVADAAETRRLLQADFGATDAEKIIQRTERFINGNPKLSAVLQKHGLANDPKLYRALATHVFKKGLGL